MRRALWLLGGVGVWGCVAALTAGGCATGITSETTIGDAANQLLNLLDESAQVAGTELTANATADATAAANANLAGPGMGRLGRGGRGGPGGPGGPGLPRELMEQLSLTDEQKEQAKAVHESVRTDIHALRVSTHEQVRAVLTAEQQAIFDENFPPPPDPTDPNFPPPGNPNCPPPDPNNPNFPPPGMGGGPGGPGAGFGGGPGAGLGGGPGRGRGPGMGGGQGMGMGMGRGLGRGPGGPPPGGPGRIERLKDLLGLTDEQVAQIEAIHQATRTAIEARHEQARTEFRAILTEEQLAILDQWEADHPRPQPPQ